MTSLSDAHLIIPTITQHSYNLTNVIKYCLPPTTNRVSLAQSMIHGTPHHRRYHHRHRQIPITITINPKGTKTTNGANSIVHKVLLDWG